MRAHQRPSRRGRAPLSLEIDDTQMSGFITTRMFDAWKDSLTECTYGGTKISGTLPNGLSGPMRRLTLIELDETSVSGEPRRAVTLRAA